MYLISLIVSIQNFGFKILIKAFFLKKVGNIRIRWRVKFIK